MILDQNLESGYKFLSLFLMESSFKREYILGLELDKTKNEISIDIKSNVHQGKIVQTIVTIDFAQKYDETLQVNCKISMSGQFERVGEPKLSDDDFGFQNAVAMIYPYIREHLSGLTVKAGMNIVLLPPIDVTKIVRQKSTE